MHKKTHGQREPFTLHHPLHVKKDQSQAARTPSFIPQVLESDSSLVVPAPHALSTPDVSSVSQDPEARDDEPSIVLPSGLSPGECATSPAHIDKKTNASPGSDDFRLGSRERIERQKRSRPRVSCRPCWHWSTPPPDHAIHPPSSRDRRCFIGRDRSVQWQLCGPLPPTSLTESAPARLDSLGRGHVGSGSVTRIATRNGRHARREHTGSQPPIERYQASSGRRTRASSAPPRGLGRSRQCGKAEKGTAGARVVGWCAHCARNHARSDRRCTACHRRNTDFNHFSAH